MAILETIASVLNWIVELFTHIASVLLIINYQFMTIVIDFTTELLNTIGYALQSAFTLFHCYSIDFCTFIEELATALYLVIAYVVYVLQSLYVILLSLTCAVFDIFQSLFLAICLSWVYVCCIIDHITTVVAYISKLVFQAVILLLMLLPNAFLCLYNILVRGVVYILSSFQVLYYHLKISVGDLTHVVKTESVNIFCSVPAKAYVGLFILVLLYYTRKPVTHHTIKCFFLLLYFVIRTVRGGSSCLHTSLLYLLSVITKPVWWVLQLVPMRISSSAAADEDQQPQGFLCSKLSLIGVFWKSLGAMFHRSKSTDINLDDPDQVTHLRYLEQKLNEERDRHLCIICQDELRTVLLLPCRHLCLCNDCWQSLKHHGVMCPVCRRIVQEAFPVYV